VCTKAQLCMRCSKAGNALGSSILTGEAAVGHGSSQHTAVDGDQQCSCSSGHIMSISAVDTGMHTLIAGYQQ
jgi:hypothetical protein